MLVYLKELWVDKSCSCLPIFLRFYNICLYTNLFKLDWVIMSIVLLCMMAMLLYGLLGIAEKRYLKRL